MLIKHYKIRGKTMVQLTKRDNTKIDILGTDFITQIIRLITTNTEIVGIDLTGSILSEQDVSNLATALKGSNSPESVECSKVKTLNLTDTEIRDDSAIVLAADLKDTSLRVLKLSQNNITDKGAIALAAGLKGSAITDLELSDNSIGNVGAITLANSLKASHLTRLDLESYYGIGTDGVEALILAIKDSNITDLKISLNYINVDAKRTKAQLFKKHESDSGVTLTEQLQELVIAINHSHPTNALQDLKALLDMVSEDNTAENPPELAARLAEYSALLIQEISSILAEARVEQEGNLHKLAEGLTKYSTLLIEQINPISARASAMKQEVSATLQTILSDNQSRILECLGFNSLPEAKRTKVFQDTIFEFAYEFMTHVLEKRESLEYLHEHPELIDNTLPLGEGGVHTEG